MTISRDSLSVILPVYNTPSLLSKRVADLLEMLPDLTVHFEILIVDNGSTDASEEIAHEFARRYPQVRAVRQAQRVSDDQLIEFGVAVSRGSFVVTYDESAPILTNQLRKMWEARAQHRIVLARSAEPDEPSLLGRLQDWASHLPATTPHRQQMIRRPVRECFTPVDAAHHRRRAANFAP